jgi:hypothetical protein
MTIKEIRARGRNIRIHGNGFLQLDLSEDGKLRLHIWDDSLPRQKIATPIHDHVFDLRSEVLCGTLIHEELKPIEVGQGTHKIYRAVQEEGTQNTVLIPDEGEVLLKTEQRLCLAAGSLYTFPAWHLHESSSLGFTATLMRKENAPDSYGRPRVLVRVGQEPDNEFHRDGFDPECLWKYVEDVAHLVHL